MLADLGVEGLGVYEADFEAPFLDATTDFYRHESLSFLAANTCPDYLAKAEARLAEEHARGRHYLHPSTELKLKRIVETELVSRHAKHVVEMESSGCAAMLRAGRVGDLQKMYKLLARVPATVDILRSAVCDHVKKVRGSWRGKGALAAHAAWHSSPEDSLAPCSNIV
jgi:cullin 3